MITRPSTLKTLLAAAKIPHSARIAIYVFNTLAPLLTALDDGESMLILKSDVERGIERFLSDEGFERLISWLVKKEVLIAGGDTNFFRRGSGIRLPQDASTAPSRHQRCYTKEKRIAALEACVAALEKQVLHLSDEVARCLSYTRM